MTRAELEDHRALELLKIAGLKAIGEAWAGRGVVTVDLATGKITAEAPRVPPSEARPCSH